MLLFSANDTPTNAVLGQTPLSRIPSASSRALSNSLSSFSRFLSTVDTLSSPRLALLSAPRLAGTIHQAALARIRDAYQRIWDEVMDEKNKYEFARTVLVRGVDEVGVMLGVDGGAQ
jgi:hypothetical protein